MLKPEFIGDTIAPCLSNTQLLFEYFSEFLEAIQFEDGTWSIQEFRKIKERAAGLKEEFEEEEEEIKDMILFEDYDRLFQDIAPAFSSFCCNEGDGSHGFWPFFDEFQEEFPEIILDKIFPYDWKEFTEEDQKTAKGYDFSKFDGKRIVYIPSLDALFVATDGIFKKI